MIEFNDDDQSAGAADDSDHSDGMRDRGPIPRDFYQECEDAPFTTCQACTETLHDGREYFIVKAYHAERCVVEFALCGVCVLELSGEFSEESWRVIRESSSAIQQHLEVARDACAYCQKSEGELLSRSKMIVCRYDRVLEQAMICDACDSASQERLSAKTRDEIDDFMQEILPGVPALEVDLPRLLLPF
ncbi:MAG: hypothetical protein AAF581_01275 [Planctomycetota bacterium]